MAEGNNDKGYSANLDAAGDWKPRPDPTLLTATAVKEAVDQLRRELDELDKRTREYLAGRATLTDSRIDALQALTEARLKAIEQAAAVFEQTLEKVPSATDIAVSHLRELHEAKFSAITNQLVERDNRYTIVSSDAKAAVADALAAQKESVYKQDTATQKAIDQQSALLTGIANGLGTQINDLKERMGRSEQANASSIIAQSSKTTSVGQLISWGLLAIAAVALVLDHLGAVAK